MTAGAGVRPIAARRNRSVALLALIGSATVAPLAAQSAPPAPPVAILARYRNRLLGVFDSQSGEPIEGAEVLDAMNKVSARTTATGTVTLAFLPDGGSVIRIQKIGYQPATLLVPISPSDTVPLTVVLVAAAQRLPTVVTTDAASLYVSPRLRGFEERRASNVGGHFIAEAELRKHDNEKVTNLVRGFPGLIVTCSRTGVHTCHASSTRLTSKNAFGGGRCPPDIYIDAALSIDDDLERLNVDQFAGVEFYAGGASMPQQYNRTGSSCGVIVFWTRER